MRKVTALVLAVLVVAAGAAWGQGAPANVMHVTGHVVVPVAADTARVECSVRADGKEPAAVAREAGSVLQQLREAITGLNLAGMVLRDTGVNVSTKQKTGLAAMEEAAGAAGAAPGSKPPSYFAVGVLIVTLYGDEAALHKNASLVTATATGNAQDLVTVTTVYSKGDDSAERQKAWEAAVHNAMANAQALAKGLGVTITGYDMVSMTPPASGVPGSSLEKTMSEAMGASMLEGLYGRAVQPPDVKPLQVDVTVYMDAKY